MIDAVVITGASGFVVGILAVVLFSRLSRRSLLREAQLEAQNLISESQSQAAAISEEIDLVSEEIREAVFAREQAEIEKKEKQVEDLEEKLRARRSQVDRDFNADRREVENQERAVQSKESKLKLRAEKKGALEAQLNQLTSELRAELKKKVPEDIWQQARKDLLSQMEEEAERGALLRAQAYEDETKLNVEMTAKKILLDVLNRFARPAPTERGIGVVEIPNPDVQSRVLGAGDANKAAIEKLTGVTLTVTEKNTFSLASFDPVAREITTRVLEKLMHEKAPTVETVERLFEKTKGEVNRRIENDGNRVAAELGCRDLHPEIKRRLGELRYRYSFAQNQHFHVAEVGWLCGLLASELGGVDRSRAKRAGLLHDVGKSMDHAIDGGHAVIGAEFIAGLGELDDVVHAVRAHHYEETPTTDLCYLVIAADAISGARPGARRSTATVYNQKMEDLLKIGDSFQGVSKTLIFHAGREVRVLVDAKRVNDKRALDLSRKLAQKIEQDVQYPGQIKVVVVRETHATATAR